ncbi:MAG TPA: hypothetical protein VNZ57_15815 [Longimicrobiales bacterium]|nr:hypothetical protein [Longimicrobiales bacterium]
MDEGGERRQWPISESFLFRFPITAHQVYEFAEATFRHIPAYHRSLLWHPDSF